jgi:hypothetical protein
LHTIIPINSSKKPLTFGFLSTALEYKSDENVEIGVDVGVDVVAPPSGERYWSRSRLMGSGAGGA